MTLRWGVLSGGTGQPQPLATDSLQSMHTHACRHTFTCAHAPLCVDAQPHTCTHAHACTCPGAARPAPNARSAEPGMAAGRRDTRGSAPAHPGAAACPGWAGSSRRGMGTSWGAKGPGLACGPRPPRTPSPSGTEGGGWQCHARVCCPRVPPAPSKQPYPSPSLPAVGARPAQGTLLCSAGNTNVPAKILRSLFVFHCVSCFGVKSASHPVFLAAGADASPAQR